MIKPNELMVGDWVSVSGKPVKITKDDLATMLIFLDDDSKIDPIPLNEEILEKNGFKKQGDLYMYHIDAGDGYLRIELVDLQDGEWSYDIDLYDKFNDSHDIHHNDRTFLKLHQLQHLLCGIEKEIEL